MPWALDDLELRARKQEELVQKAVSEEQRERHLRAANTLRSRIAEMRNDFRASLGVGRLPPGC